MVLQFHHPHRGLPAVGDLRADDALRGRLEGSAPQHRCPVGRRWGRGSPEESVVADEAIQGRPGGSLLAAYHRGDIRVLLHPSEQAQRIHHAHLSLPWLFHRPLAVVGGEAPQAGAQRVWRLPRRGGTDIGGGFRGAEVHPREPRLVPRPSWLPELLHGLGPAADGCLVAVGHLGFGCGHTGVVVEEPAQRVVCGGTHPGRLSASRRHL